MEMASLKESGALEADGDYVAMLNRPYVLDKTGIDKDTGEKFRPEQAQILLDKNKFGKTGVIDLHFDVEHQKFYEVDKSAGKYGAKPAFRREPCAPGDTPF